MSLPAVVERVPRPDHLLRAARLMHAAEKHPDAWPPVIKLSSPKHPDLLDGWVQTSAVKQLEQALGSVVPDSEQYATGLNKSLFCQISNPPQGYLYVGNLEHAIAQLRARIPVTQQLEVCIGEGCPLRGFKPVVTGPSQTVQELQVVARALLVAGCDCGS